ncbi:hypothetical protein Aglo03_12330 [Actinokineospora globicatena]|uniref:CHAT domain-containing protein n=2 Tax=Actinokineospora globicatena TaxID=103729 RepID=A0A9W6QJ37_9PSEU|nr:hypothetical protein Aglo03_12330 [Actinokineospora globicatena]
MAGDRDAVLGVDALIDAARLVLPTVRAEPPLSVVVELTWLHWSRYQALPEPEDQAELRICLVLAGALIADEPARLPQPVREWYATTGAERVVNSVSRYYTGVLCEIALGVPDLVADAILLARTAGLDLVDHANNVIILLWNRFHRAGDPTDLDELIATAENILRTEETHPILGQVRLNLGRALAQRADLVDDPRPDLSAALPHLRTALASVENENPERPVYLLALAHPLLASIFLGATDAELDECEGVAREALDRAPNDMTVFESTLVLADALRWRSVLHNDPADAEEAIRLVQAALPVVAHDQGAHDLLRRSLAVLRTSQSLASGAETPPPELLAEIRDLGAPDLWDEVVVDERVLRVRARAAAVDRARAAPEDPVGLGIALHELAEASGDLDHLAEASRVLRSAVAADGSSERALEHLARVSVTAFMVEESDTRLDEAAAALGAAVPLLRDARTRREFLGAWVQLLGLRFARTSALEGLDEYVSGLRSAVALATDEDDKPRFLTTLVEALRVKAIDTQSLEHVDEFVDAAIAAVEATRPGDEHLAVRQALAGRALVDRFGLSSDPADPVLALRLLRSAVNALVEGHPYRHTALLNLASALQAENEATHGTDGSDEAVLLCRTVLAAGGDTSRRAALLVAEVLAHRFGQTGMVHDLDDAVAVLRGVATEVDEHQRVAVVAEAVSVLARYRTLDRLTEAVDWGRRALDSVPLDHDDRVELAGAVVIALARRHDLTKRPEDLDDAIDLARWAVDRCPTHLPSRAKHVYWLARSLRVRWTTSGEVSDVDEAIAVLRSADVVPGHPVAVALGSALAARARAGAGVPDLGEAIDLLAAAVRHYPPGHRDRLRSVVSLADTLAYGVIETEDLDRLTGAVELVARAVDEHPTVDGMALSALGRVYCAWYERAGDLRHLVEGVAALRTARERDLPERAVAAIDLTLAMALLSRHHRLGDAADLADAVTHAHLVLESPTVGVEHRADALLALATCLTATGIHDGGGDSLDEAERLAREVLALPADRPITRVLRLKALATPLLIKFSRTGALGDLNAAVENFRAGLAALAEGHPERAGLVLSLSSALTTRADLLGASDDVDEAVATARRAVELVPIGSPHRGAALENLTNALLLRRDSTRRVDLDEAVAVAELGLAECPDDHPDRVRHLTNLARILRVRAAVAPETVAVDLDRAIGFQREAITAAGAEHYLAPMFSTRLADTLLGRYARFGDDQDAVDAAAWATRAVEAMSPDNPDRAIAYLHLGSVLLVRYKRRRAVRDWSAALDALRSAAQASSAPVVNRVYAAWRWGELAGDRDDWAVAQEGYTTAVDLLSQVVSPGLDHHGGERRLKAWDGLVAGAAAVALSAGDPGRAVEVLEQGRSVLWSRELRTRDEFTDLRDRDPDLHSRLREVAAALAMAPDESGMPVPGLPNVADSRIQLAGEWDRLVAAARALPGMAGFLRTPSLAEIRAGLPAGPVVVITLDANRCDALIVSRDHDVDHVPLPGLTRSEARDQAEVYLAALDALGGPGRFSAVQTVHATLEWLWDKVAEPVLARLGADGAGPLPRVWWCPTGPLTMLPLHAAGYHDPDDTPFGRTVIDRVVSSYTPTLRALTRATTAPPPTRDTRVLVVSMPETPSLPGIPDLSPLPGARAEAEFLTRTLPHTLRASTTATRSAVLADLRTHTHAHFACHGAHNPQDPSGAALYLNDGPLTVLDIAAQDLTHAELAYLSACHTAGPGTTLPDESIHIAAALQLAGYRHVIATLWTIPDDTASELATSVYSALTDGRGLNLTETARTLHGATRALRDAAPLEPTNWVPFIHIGP